MSQFLSNKYLKYRDALRGKPITEVRLCDHCDYNLKGLMIGGRCPECGTAITMENPAEDALVNAPVRVIRSLRNGFWLIVPAIVIIAGLPFAGIALRNQAWQAVVLLAVAIVLWTCGVWMLTTPSQTARGERDGFGKRSKLRIATRWLNIAWIGEMIVTMLLVFTVPIVGGGANLLLGVCTTMFLMAGIAGLVMLTITLGRLADWCYDEFAAKWLTWALWSVPLGMLMLLSPLVIRPLGILICSGSLVWISGLVALTLAIASLAKSVTWSLHHAIERAERNRALATRQFEQQDKLQPRVATDE